MKTTGKPEAERLAEKVHFHELTLWQRDRETGDWLAVCADCLQEAVVKAGTGEVSGSATQNDCPNLEG